MLGRKRQADQAGFTIDFEGPIAQSVGLHNTPDARGEQHHSKKIAKQSLGTRTYLIKLRERLEDKKRALPKDMPEVSKVALENLEKAIAKCDSIIAVIEVQGDAYSDRLSRELKEADQLAELSERQAQNAAQFIEEQIANERRVAEELERRARLIREDRPQVKINRQVEIKRQTKETRLLREEQEHAKKMEEQAKLAAKKMEEQAKLAAKKEENARLASEKLAESQRKLAQIAELRNMQATQADRAKAEKALQAEQANAKKLEEEQRRLQAEWAESQRKQAILAAQHEAQAREAQAARDAQAAHLATQAREAARLEALAREAARLEALAREAARLEALARAAPAPVIPPPIVYTASFNLKPVPANADYKSGVGGIVAPGVASAKDPADKNLTLAKFTKIATDYRALADLYRKYELQQGKYSGIEEKDLIAQIDALGTITNPAIWLTDERDRINHNYKILREYVKLMPIGGGSVNVALEKASQHVAEVKLDVEVRHVAFNAADAMKNITPLIAQEEAAHKKDETEFKRLQAALLAGTAGVTKKQVDDAEDAECRAKNKLKSFMAQYVNGGDKVEDELKTFGVLFDAVYKAEHDLWQHDRVSHFIKGVALTSGRVKALESSIAAIITGYENIKVLAASAIAFQLLGQLDTELPDGRIQKYIPTHDWTKLGLRIEAAKEKVKNAHASEIVALEKKLEADLQALVIKHAEITNQLEAKDAIGKWVALQKQNLSDLQTAWETKIKEEFKAMGYRNTAVPLEDPPKTAVEAVAQENNNYYTAGLGEKTRGAKSGAIGRLDQYIICNNTMLDTIAKKYNAVVDAAVAPINTAWYKNNIETKFTTENLDMKNVYFPGAPNCQAALVIPTFPYQPHNSMDKCIFDINEFCPPVHADGKCPPVAATPNSHRDNVLYLVAQVRAITKAANVPAATLAAIQTAGASIAGPPLLVVDSTKLCNAVIAANTAVGAHIDDLKEGRAVIADIKAVIDNTANVKNDPVLGQLTMQYLNKIPDIVIEMEKYPAIKSDLEAALESNDPANLWPKALSDPFKTYAAALRTYRTAYITYHFTHLTAGGTDVGTAAALGTFDTAADVCVRDITALTGSMAKDAVAEDFTSCQALPGNYINNDAATGAPVVHKKVTDAWGALDATFEARKIPPVAAPAGLPVGVFFGVDIGTLYTQLVATYNDEIVKNGAYDVKTNTEFNRIHDFINTDLRAISVELIDVTDYDSARTELLKMDAKIQAALNVKTPGLDAFLAAAGALAESRITPAAYPALAATPAATTTWRTGLNKSLELFNNAQIQKTLAYWPGAEGDCKDDLQNKLPAAFTFNYAPASYANIKAGYETEASFIADRDAAFNAFNTYDAKNATTIKNNFIGSFNLYTKAKLDEYHGKLNKFAADHKETQTFVNTKASTKNIADELTAYVAAYNAFLGDGKVEPSDVKVNGAIAALATEILKTVRANIKPVQDLIQEINKLNAKFTALSGLNFKPITDALAKVQAMYDKHNNWEADPQVKNGLSTQMLTDIKTGIHATIDTIITALSCDEARVAPDATLPGQINAYLTACVAYIGLDAAGKSLHTDNENSELCAEVLALVTYIEKLPYHATYGHEKGNMRKFHGDNAGKFNIATLRGATSKAVQNFELVYNTAAPMRTPLSNAQKQTFIDAMEDEKDFNEIKKYGADLTAIIIDPRLWAAADFKKDVLDVYKNRWYYSGPNVVNAFTHWSTYTIGQRLKLKSDSVHTCDVMAKITECFAAALNFTKVSRGKAISPEQQTVQNEINYLSITYPTIIGWIRTNGTDKLRPYIQIEAKDDKYVAMFAPVQITPPGKASFTPEPLIKRLVVQNYTPFTPPLNLLAREIYDVESYNLAPLTQWDIKNNKYVAEDSKYMNNLFALIGHIPTSAAEWGKLNAELSRFQSALKSTTEFNKVYHPYVTFIQKIIAANADTPIKIGIQCKEYPNPKAADTTAEDNRCDSLTNLYNTIFAGAFHTITILYISTKVREITDAYNACADYINKNLYVYDENDPARHVNKMAKFADNAEIFYTITIPRKSMTTGNYARFIYEQNNNQLYYPDKNPYTALLVTLIDEVVAAIRIGKWDKNNPFMSKFIINQNQLMTTHKSCIGPDISTTIRNFITTLTQNMIDNNASIPIAEIIGEEKKDALYLAFADYISKHNVKKTTGDDLELIKKEIMDNIPTAPATGSQFYNTAKADENLIDMATLYGPISVRLTLPKTTEATVDALVDTYNTTYGADGKFAPFATGGKKIAIADKDKIAALLYALQNPRSANRASIFRRLTTANYDHNLPDPATVAGPGPGPGGRADPNLMLLGDKSQHILYFRPFVGTNNESRMEKKEFYNATHLKNKTVYLSNGSNATFGPGLGSQEGIQNLSMGFTMVNTDGNTSLLDGTRLTLIVKNQKEVKGERKQKYDLAAIPNLKPEIDKVDLYTGTVLLAEPAITPTDFRANIAGVYHILGRAYRDIGGDEKKYVGFVSQYYTAILQDYAAKCKSAIGAGKFSVALHLACTPGKQFKGTEITKYAFRRAVMKFLEFHQVADNDIALTISVDLPKDIGADEKSTNLYKYDFANNEPWTGATTVAAIADSAVKEAGKLLIKSLDVSSARQYANLVRRIHDAAGKAVVREYGKRDKGKPDDDLTVINNLVVAAETAADINPGDCGDIVSMAAPGPRAPSPLRRPPSPPKAPVKIIVKPGVITAANSECINGVIVHYVPVDAGDLSTQPNKKEYYENYPDAKISISTACNAAGKISVDSSVRFINSAKQKIDKTTDPPIFTFKKLFIPAALGLAAVRIHSFNDPTKQIKDAYCASTYYTINTSAQLNERSNQISIIYYAILHHFDTQNTNDVLQLMVMTPTDGQINYLLRQAIYKYCYNRKNNRQFIINVSIGKDITALEKASLPYVMDSMQSCTWVVPGLNNKNDIISSKLKATLADCTDPKEAIFRPMFAEKGNLKNIELDSAKWPLINAPATVGTSVGLLAAVQAIKLKYTDAVQAVKALLNGHNTTYADDKLKTAAELKNADSNIDAIITNCTTTNNYKNIVDLAVMDAKAVAIPAVAAADADITAADDIKTDSANWATAYAAEYKPIEDRKKKITANLTYIIAIESARALIVTHTGALEAIRSAAAAGVTYADDDVAQTKCTGWKTDADLLFTAIAAEYQKADDAKLADVFNGIAKHRERLNAEFTVIGELQGLIDNYVRDETAYIAQWRALYQAQQTEIKNETGAQAAADAAAADVAARNALIKTELDRPDSPAGGPPPPASPTTVKAAVTQAAIDAVLTAVAADGTITRAAREAAAKAAAEGVPGLVTLDAASQTAAVAAAVSAAVPASPAAGAPDFNALVTAADHEVKTKITGVGKDSPDLEVAALLVTKVKNEVGAYTGDKTALHADLKKVTDAMQTWTDNTHDDTVYAAICTFEKAHPEFDFAGDTGNNPAAVKKPIDFTAKMLKQITADTAADIKDEYVHTIRLVATAADTRAKHAGILYEHTRETVKRCMQLPDLLKQYRVDNNHDALIAAINAGFKHDNFVEILQEQNKQYITAITDYAFGLANYKTNPQLLIAGAVMSTFGTTINTLTDIKILSAYKCLAAIGETVLRKTPWNSVDVLKHIDQLTKFMPADFNNKNNWFTKCTGALSDNKALPDGRASNVKDYTRNFIREVNIKKYSGKVFKLDEIFNESADDVGFLIRVVDKFNNTSVTDTDMIHEISECAAVFKEVNLTTIKNTLVGSDAGALMTNTYTRGVAKPPPLPNKIAKAVSAADTFMVKKIDPELIAAYEILKYTAVEKHTTTTFPDLAEDLFQHMEDWNGSKNDTLARAIGNIILDIYRAKGTDLTQIPNVSGAFISEITAIRGAVSVLTFDEVKVSTFLYDKIIAIYGNPASTITDYFNGKKAALIIYNDTRATPSEASLATANNAAAAVLNLSAEVTTERARLASTTHTGTKLPDIQSTDLSKLNAVDIYSKLALFALEQIKDQAVADKKEDPDTFTAFQKLYNALESYSTTPDKSKIPAEIAALVSQAKIKDIYEAKEKELHLADIENWIKQVKNKCNDAPFNFAEEMLKETIRAIKPNTVKAANVSPEAKKVYDEIMVYDGKNSAALDVVAIALAKKINKPDYQADINIWVQLEINDIKKYCNAKKNPAFDKANRCIDAAKIVYDKDEDINKETSIYGIFRKIRQIIHETDDGTALDNAALDTELASLAALDPAIQTAHDAVAGGGIKHETAYKATNATAITAETDAAADTAAALAAQKRKTTATKNAFDTGTKAGDGVFDAKETAQQALVTFGNLNAKLRDAIVPIVGGNQPRTRYISRPRPDNDQTYESSWSFSWLGWLALAVVMCIIIYMLYLIFKPKQKKIVIYNFRPQSGPLYVDKPKGAAYATC